MKNTLWHFGDSFGTWGNKGYPDKEAKKGYSEYIAEHYNLNFNHHCYSGYSNTEILKEILLNYNLIKKGDFILINWSFLNRDVYVDWNKKTTSTNTITHGLNPNNFELKKHAKKCRIDNIDYLNYLLFEKPKFRLYENLIFWKNFANPILSNLINTGCVIINSFNDSYIEEKIGAVNIQETFLDDGGDIIKLNWFDCNNNDKEYVSFINEMGYRDDDGDQHYKFGIQQELSQEWIDRIDNQIL